MDNNVRYEHLADWRPDLVRVSTPDWLIHLAAHQDHFDGVVTSDYHQLGLDEEAVALDRTRLTVITWTKGIDNAIVLWGSLLSYMPQIRQAIERRGPVIVRLPVPHLRPEHVEVTPGISQRHARTQKITAPQLRSAVIPDMVEELRARGMEDLIELLESGRPPRP